MAQITRTMRGVRVSVAQQAPAGALVTVEINEAGELAGPLGARVLGDVALPGSDAPLAQGQVLAGQGALALVVPRWSNGYFGEQVALERSFEQLYASAAGAATLAIAQPGLGGGFDLEPAALIALNTLVRFAEAKPGALTEVVFVAADAASVSRFEERLVEVALTMIGTPTEHPTA
jgi:hypothetical protein